MTEETVPGMAEAVEGRRRELRLRPGQFAQAAGLTPQGLDPVRKGIRRSYSEKTLDGVAQALRWPTDWYDRLQAGEDPTALSDAVPADQSDYNSKISRLSPEAQAVIDTIIDAEIRKQQS